MAKYKKEQKGRRVLTIAILVLIVVLLVILAVVGIGKGKQTKAIDKKDSNTTSSETTKENPESTEAQETSTTESETVKATGEGAITFDTDAAYAENHKYCVGVNRKENVVTVYGKDDNGKFTKPVKAILCSCGMASNDADTPTGTFKTSDKVRWLWLVNNTYGQYTMRINSHIWFHSVPYFSKDPSNLEYEEYNKLGTQASLGCVRLSVADAKWLYDNLDYNTIVTIYDSNEPGPLGKPDGIKIDVNNKNRGWDPTDPDTSNPWKS